MKNELRKFLTLGAALAGSALMVSCDGDDGQNGINGVNGVDGNTPNLAVEAPNPILLPLAKISAIVDTVDNSNGVSVFSDGSTIDIGERFSFDFQSANFADIVEDRDGNNIGSANSAITYNVLNSTQFTVNYNVGAADNTATFTVLSSLDKTLIGTFTSSAQVLTPGNSNANVNVKPDGSDTLGTVVIGGDNYTTSKASTADLIELTDSAANVLTTLSANSIVYGSTNNVFFIDSSDAAYDFNTDTPPLAGATDVFFINNALQDSNGNTITLAQDVLYKVFVTPNTTQTITPVSGTFRMDFNPSQGGSDDLDIDGLEN